MKNYIKPTFTLAGLVPVALASDGCNISERDKEEIESLYGHEWSKLFVDAETDRCEEATYLEGTYCKMAYADNGSLKLFNSF